LVNKAFAIIRVQPKASETSWK
jgi:hypothetical protein